MRGPQGGTAWAPADRAATDFADSLYLVWMKEGGRGGMRGEVEERTVSYERQVLLPQ